MVSPCPSADEDALKVTHEGEHGQMRASQTPGAEDAENGGIAAREKFCGDRGGCGGAQVGEVVGSNGQAGLRGFRIEQQVRGLDAAVAESRARVGGLMTLAWRLSLGVVAHEDQLHSQSACGAVVARHGKENSVGQFCMSALRKADGGIAIAKCGLDGSAELPGIEEAANVGFGQTSTRHCFKSKGAD